MNSPHTQMPGFRDKLATEQIAPLAELIYAALLRGQRSPPSRGFTLCNKFPHGRNQIGWNFHDGLTGRFIGGFIFRDRFFLGLRLVMGKHLPYPFFVPARGELTLFHFHFLRRRRR